MKFALDDLKIVDVERKPKGLGPDLKASEEFLQDAAARQALTSRGFYVGPALEGEGLDLISSDGEVIIGTKDAVEYVLRFGEVAGMTGEGDDSQLNRYLFVTARLDDDALQYPELEPLPERPTDKPTDDETGESEPPEEKAPATTDDDDADAPDEDAPAKTGPEGPQGEPGAEGGAGDAADAAGAEPSGEDAADSAETTADSAETTDDSAEATDDSADTTDAGTETTAVEETTGDADATEAAAGEAAETPAEDATSDAAAPGETAGPDAAGGDDESSADEIIDLDAEIERINKENQRKIDEHKEKVKKAEKKLRELNARFGDWYFVISDDVYKKIHLSKANVIKEKESAKTEGTGVDAFRGLEEGGIEGDDE
jgi:hypothetical protein